MSIVAASSATACAQVKLGGVHFRITDLDACALAIAAGALADGESLICLRVVFTPTEPGSTTPWAGDVVALPDDDGLALLFTVVAIHHAVQAPGTCGTGPHAMGHDMLQPGEALLVQLINSTEEQ